ncbi:MAG: pilus (MSHA type) biogenesis protein MshL [Helicobacteraceae bacterium]|jgi:general secretion pathway protein D|nr:pilus (MSHA type) biogenesis protein MshL [Helicobacteraceae bacterium]
MKTLRLSCLIAVTAIALHGACANDRFDITVKEPILLRDALLAVIDECDLSLSLEGAGTADRFEEARVGYISLRAVNAEEAIDFLMQRANLHHELRDNLLIVKQLDTRTFKLDFINNSRTGSSSADIKIGGSASSGGGSDSSSGDSSTKITTEETFDFWSTLDEEIVSILSRPEDGEVVAQKAVMVNSASGLVTVTGTRRQLDRVSAYIERMLIAIKKQVLIDVQILSVDLADDKHTGVDWAKMPLSMPNGGFVYEYDSLTGTTAERTWTFGTAIDLTTQPHLQGTFINFLQTYGETRALSNPKVVAMNNQPTLISVGNTINYLLQSETVLSGGGTGTTQSTEQESIFVGVLLDITPQIDDDGYITLRMNPSISELKYPDDDVRQSVPRTIAPDTVTRSISSVVRVRDGEVIVLGGLINKSKVTTESKLPVLGDLPFLGKLFSSKRNSDITKEIVFVLTPHIISDNKQKPSLKDLGFSSEAAELYLPTQNSPAVRLKELDE